MKALKQLRNLSIDSGTIISLAKILYPEYLVSEDVKDISKLGKDDINRLLRNVEAKDYKFEENPFELAGKVNKMVKDPSCPKNLKNRFYYNKHRMISKCMRLGNVEIWSEENCYSFLICGKYQFHQPKNWFKTPLKTLGERKLAVSKDYIEFDEKTYNDFYINLIIFLGRKNKES